MRSIDFRGYDIVINDFEPITAWAAKLKKVKTIGISHQMSFKKEIPISGKDFIANSVLKNFAPVLSLELKRGQPVWQFFSLFKDEGCVLVSHLTFL